MAQDTICGVPLGAFKGAPTPEEIASIVARFSGGDQAEFFSYLGEKIKDRSSNGVGAMRTIAIELVDLEDRICDGGGSNLLKHLAQFIAEYDPKAGAA